MSDEAPTSGLGPVAPVRIHVAGNDDSSPSGIWVGTRQDSAHTLLVDPHTMAITVGGTPPAGPAG